MLVLCFHPLEFFAPIQAIKGGGNAVNSALFGRLFGVPTDTVLSVIFSIRFSKLYFPS